MTDGVIVEVSLSKRTELSPCILDERKKFAMNASIFLHSLLACSGIVYEKFIVVLYAILWCVAWGLCIVAFDDIVKKEFSLLKFCFYVHLASIVLWVVIASL